MVASVVRRALNPSTWVWLVVAWFVTLFLLSSNPHPPSMPGVPFQDKILHTLYFTGGSMAVFMALQVKQRPVSRVAAMALAVMFCAAVGAFDEWHQTFTPGRSGNDPYDWLADVTGGVLGFLLGLLVHRWLRTRAADLDPGDKAV